jgi:hypothetical protein
MKFSVSAEKIFLDESFFSKYNSNVMDKGGDSG